MEKIFDFKKFEKEISNKQLINSEEILTRKILGIITKSQSDNKDLVYLLELDMSALCQAEKELNKPIEEMNILKDMIVGEYLKSNVKATPIFDEEEIY